MLIVEVPRGHGAQAPFDMNWPLEQPGTVHSGAVDPAVHTEVGRVVVRCETSRDMGNLDNEKTTACSGAGKGTWSRVHVLTVRGELRPVSEQSHLSSWRWICCAQQQLSCR